MGSFSLEAPVSDDRHQQDGVPANAFDVNTFKDWTLAPGGKGLISPPSPEGQRLFAAFDDGGQGPSQMPLRAAVQRGFVSPDVFKSDAPADVMQNALALSRKVQGIPNPDPPLTPPPSPAPAVARVSPQPVPEPSEGGGVGGRVFQSLAGAMPAQSEDPVSKSLAGQDPALVDYIRKQFAGQQQGLQDAQDAAAKNRLVAGLEGAGATIAGAFARRAPDYTAAKMAMQNANSPVEEYGRNLVLQQQQAEQDPSSPENQRARAALGGLIPQEMKGPGFDLLTKPGLMRYVEDARFRQGLDAQAKARAAELAQGRERLDETERHNRATEKTGAAPNLRDQAYYDRAQILKEKWKAEQEALGNVPIGDDRAVVFDNPRAHTTKETVGFRDQVATTNALNQQLDNLEELVNSVPAGEKVIPSAAAAQLQATRNGVIANVNKALGLGAITQGHQGLLMGTIQDPTKLINAFDKDRVLAGINELRQNLELNIQGRAKSLGGRIVTRGQEPSDAQPASPSAGSSPRPPPADGRTPVKKQYSPSRNQTRTTYSDGSVEVTDGRA